MRRASLTLKILAVLVGLTACGSDDEAGSGTTARAQATVRATAGPTDTAAMPATTASAESALPPTSATSVPQGSGTGSDAGAGLCALNERMARLFVELVTGDEPEATWGEIDGVAEQLIENLPPELADGAAAAEDYFDELRANLEAADWDVNVMTPVSSPAAEEFETRINSYIEAAC